MKYNLHIKIYTWHQSPSMRREWIEISKHTAEHNRGERSPSMRREWIEMNIRDCPKLSTLRLPPCGGSGLKWNTCGKIILQNGSPSMRREWIEITTKLTKEENG